MPALAGNNHAFLIDTPPQFCRCSSAHPQLQHRLFYAVKFEYEHRPDFEEGQKLPTRLLDSLITNKGFDAAAKKERLPAPSELVDQFWKPAAPNQTHRKHKHNQTEKRHASGQSRVSKKAGTSVEDNGSNSFVTDYDLFSFDHVPTYEEDDYVVPIFKDDVHPGSLARKHSGQVSRKENRCSFDAPFLQQEAYTDDDNSNDSYQDNDNDNASQDPVAPASYEQYSFPLQQNNFPDDVPSQPLGKAFNRLQFARTYNLVALRVSLAECESLATSLKGHLLNWPRISNIARVEGDEMEWDSMRPLIDRKKGSNEDRQELLLQAVYGTVTHSGRALRRVKSAQKLSARQFRFLESISRPGHEAVTDMKSVRDSRVKILEQNSKKLYMVQLGNSFQSKLQILEAEPQLLPSTINGWRGPFRLLLLDLKYARQSKLPMAVQVMLKECKGHKKTGQTRDIVPCNLTIFYDYWSMEEILNHLLPTGETLPLAIKVLGHVAVLHLTEQYGSVRFLIGKVILDKHRPRVKTVINTSEEMECGAQPTLEVLAGNHSVVTSIVENNLQFLVNLATVHWDLELAVERQRLVQRFSKKDIVCDVCAGAGALALLAATKVWRVFANNPIPDAWKYAARNVNNNKLQAKVELYNLECCVFIKKLLAFKRPVLVTQIVFSLPTNAVTVLDALKGAFCKSWPLRQPLPMVHVYGYSDTQPLPETDFSHDIVERLGLSHKAVEFYDVKALSSGRRLMCASFQIPETLAFDD